MRLRTAVALVFFGSLTAGVLACDVEPERAGRGNETVSATKQPIKGGYADSSDTATVGIFDNQIGALCSGSLLTPNLVLTARHCVSDILNEVQGGVDCSKTTAAKPHAAKNFFVTTKNNLFSQNAADYHTVREVLTVPSENQLLCGNDQAILILSDNVDPSEAVPLVPRVDSILAKGEQYYAVGFGATNDSGSGAGQRRRRDNLFVSCTEGQCNAFGIQKATEWEGDQGICEGDSGGPAFDMQNRVVGVTSRGIVGCEDPIYGSVHAWGQWIMESALHAAELGGYPPPPWATGFPTDPEFNLPIGGACDDTCASGVCMNDVCSRLCTDAAFCPDGYECDPINETQSACALIPEPPPPTKKKQVTETTCAASVVALGASSSGDKDPTNPVPWFAPAALVAGLAVGARLRRRRRDR
ncbi:MAG: S1 family peptidase [Polyangiaceae bacterium]